jgi:hypothetical protein
MLSTQARSARDHDDDDHLPIFGVERISRKMAWLAYSERGYTSKGALPYGVHEDRAECTIKMPTTERLAWVSLLDERVLFYAGKV